MIVCSFESPVFPGDLQLEFLGMSLEPDTDIGVLASGGSGRVLGMLRGGTRIFEIRPDLTRTQLFAGVDGQAGRDLVVDAAGNLYVATDDSRLLAIRPDGSIRAELFVNAFAIDLAADQCTLFYLTGGPTVRRHNVCTNTALPDFAAPGALTLLDLQLLPDGGLLVLREPLSAANFEVVRYDSSGVVRRVYPLTGSETTLALGRAGRTMLVAGGCDALVREYDLTTGTLLRTAAFQFDSTLGVVAYNGFTAALGPTAAAHSGAAIPSLSTVMLAVLGVLLAFVPFRRI